MRRRPRPAPAPRAKAMGLGVTQAMASEVVPAAHNTTVVAKAGALDPMMSGAQRLDSPWLRAAMLTPSVSAAMTTTRLRRRRSAAVRGAAAQAGRRRWR